MINIETMANNDKALLKARSEFPLMKVSLYRPENVNLEEKTVSISNWDDEESLCLLNADELESYEFTPPVSIADCVIVENYAPEFGRYTLVACPII